MSIIECAFALPRENRLRCPSKARHAALIAGLLVLCTTAPAGAFDESAKLAASQHYEAAKGFYAQRNYVEAAKTFQLAFQAVPLPVLALWAARSYQLAGDLAMSQALYREAIRLSPNELWLGDKQQLAQRDATRELDELATELVAARPRSASPRTQDTNADPSADAHTATDSGAREPSSHVRTDRSPWNTVGWASVALGGAALVFGAATGLVLGSQHSEMESKCPDRICDPDSITRAQVDQHNSLRFASTVGLVTGGLLTAAGITLILTTPKRESTPQLALRITPMGPVAEGAF